MKKLQVGEIDSIIQRSHSMSVEKGWWDGEREHNEIDALIHTELAEATEAYREGKMEMYFHENGKPDGFVVEMADVVIRACDELGRIGYKSEVDDDVISNCYNHASKSDFGKPIQIVNRLHILVADCSKSGDVESSIAGKHGLSSIRARTLEAVIVGCFTACHLFGLDIHSAIEAKLSYNATRPHRHGGKLA